LTFKLFDGQSYQETNSIGYRDTVLDQTIVSFDEQMLIIPLDDYAFSRSDEDRFGNEVMAKDLKTLRHDQDSLSEEYYNYYPEQFRRFIYSSGMAYISQLDSSNHVAVDKIKGNLPYSVIDSLKEYVNQGFYSNAEQEIYRSVEGVDLHERDSYRYTDQIKRMSIEAYRKLALSLACLIFFFIGAPLGAIIRKGGLGTPVIISIMFFVVYYAVDLTGKKMARDGAITPFVGAFISSAVLLPVGIFLTIKSSQDSALFNLDSYKNAFEQIIGRLRKHRRKIISIMRKKGGKIDIVYMGTPEFAVAPLEALLETEFNIRAVVTVPDKQSGRGLQLRESAVKQFAVSKGIPVMQPVSLKDPAFLEQLKALDADIFIVVAFRMLPKEV
ncbi:MAG: LptF/LptG family permease, partial [Bacteroidales bacterium]|nr:LptF/LptG family permease [Bacteroidales bacterium]